MLISAFFMLKVRAEGIDDNLAAIMNYHGKPVKASNEDLDGAL